MLGRIRCPDRVHRLLRGKPRARKKEKEKQVSPEGIRGLGETHFASHGKLGEDLFLACLVDDGAVVADGHAEDRVGLEWETYPRGGCPRDGGGRGGMWETESARCGRQSAGKEPCRHRRRRRRQQ